MDDNLDKTIAALQKEKPGLIAGLQKKIKEQKSEIFRFISDNDFKNGLWFEKLLLKLFKEYSAKVSVDYFRKKYDTAQKDIIAKKLIDSYIKYNTAIGLVLGGAGGLWGLTTAVTTSLPEIALVTYNQLKMLYDLSVIYDNKLDINDPEELFVMLILSFNIKLNELFKEGANFALNTTGKIFISMGGQRLILNTIQSSIYQSLGKQIFKQSMAHIASKTLPLIGSIMGAATCAVSDYLTTKGVARKGLYYFRTSKLMVEFFEANDRIDPIFKQRKGFFSRKKDAKEYQECSQILAAGCYLIINAETTIDHNKMSLVEYIYETKPLSPDFVEKMKSRIKISTKEFLYQLEQLTLADPVELKEVKHSIYFAMQLIAVCDNKISKEELAILEKVGAVLKIGESKVQKELAELKRELFVF